MKNLNNYIAEKLIVNNDSKLSDNKIEDIILDYLEKCKWFGYKPEDFVLDISPNKEIINIKLPCAGITATDIEYGIIDKLKTELKLNYSKSAWIGPHKTLILRKNEKDK